MMRSLPLFLFLIPWNGLLSAESRTVQLYAEPDTSAAIVASLPLDSPLLGEPVPVFNSSLAALGWQVAPFTATRTGFIADSEIGKDLAPVPHAVLREAPSPTAPVLGTCLPDASAEILDRGPFWKVETTVEFPVYLLPAQAPALPTPPPDSPDPDNTTAQSEPAQLLPEPEPAPQPTPTVIQTAPVVDAPATPAAQQPVADQTAPSPKAYANTTALFQGTFQRASRGFLGLRNPPFPFILEDDSGRRIGYVDTESILISGSLRNFLGQPVLLRAVRSYDDQTKEWILHARHMRRR